MADPRSAVLAIDPGTEKCGLALVRPGVAPILRVLPTAELAAAVAQLCREQQPAAVLLGDGTASEAVGAQLGETPVPVRRVPERGTTLRARERYWRDHPPRGWRRLLPTSLQTPPAPVDAYAALLLAEAYLAAGDPAQESPAGDGK